MLLLESAGCNVQRYGEEAADLVAGSLYAVPNFHGGSTHIACMSLSPELNHDSYTC